MLTALKILLFVAGIYVAFILVHVAILSPAYRQERKHQNPPPRVTVKNGCWRFGRGG